MSDELLLPGPQSPEDALETLEWGPVLSVDGEAWDAIYRALTTNCQRLDRSPNKSTPNNVLPRIENIKRQIAALSIGHRERRIHLIIDALRLINHHLMICFPYTWIYSRPSPDKPDVSTVFEPIPETLTFDSAPIHLVAVLARLCFELEKQTSGNGLSQIARIRCTKIRLVLLHMLHGLYLENHPGHCGLVTPSSTPYRRMLKEDTLKISPIVLSVEVSEQSRSLHQKRDHEPAEGHRGRQITVPQAISSSTNGESSLYRLPVTGDAGTAHSAAVEQAQDAMALSVADGDYLSQERADALSSSTLDAEAPAPISRTSSQAPSAGEQTDAYGHVKRKAKDSKFDQVLKRQKGSGVCESNRTSTDTSRAGSEGRKSPKTTKEQEKGIAINKNGVMADHPCNNAECRKRPDSCIVPLDPRPPKKSAEGFNTFKCGRCVGNKSRCGFDKNNLPREYSPEILKDCPEAAKRYRSSSGAGKGANSTTSSATRSLPGISSSPKEPHTIPELEAREAREDATGGSQRPLEIGNGHQETRQLGNEANNQEEIKPWKSPSFTKGKISYLLNDPDNQET